MNPNGYRFDVIRLIEQNLPNALATAKHKAWLNLLHYPLEACNSNFKRFVDFLLFRSSISSSVCRLEYLLNSLFYPNGLTTAYNRRIKIERITYQDAAYLYLGDGGAGTAGGIDGQPIEENKALDLYLEAENDPIFLYTNTELGYNGGADFVVKIPYPEVRLNEAVWRSWLDFYALPDKVYTFIYY